MLKKIFFGFFISIVFNSLGLAQNLVPNPSFEDIVTCPNWYGQIDYTKYWYSASAAGTPDLFNNCNLSIFGVPNNYCGYTYAQEGSSYVGIACYYKTYYNAREIIQVPLISSLIKDKKYRLSFYIKLAHVGSMYAVNSIASIISENPIFFTSDSLKKYPPQIIYNDSVLEDSINWQKITGEFISIGNEKFISIGNFLSDEELTINLVNNQATYPSAYYYIDNVSLIILSSDSTDTANLDQTFNVYPTLTNDLIYLDYSNIAINNTRFILMDICGRKVKEVKIENSTEKIAISTAGIAGGLYLYRLESNGIVLFSGKIVVAK